VAAHGQAALAGLTGSPPAAMISNPLPDCWCVGMRACVQASVPCWPSPGRWYSAQTSATHRRCPTVVSRQAAGAAAAVRVSTAGACMRLHCTAFQLPGFSMRLTRPLPSG
jgi:hypothetical protein